MFNGSFLRVCRILRFVKKIRFYLLESGRTKSWCSGLVSPASAKAQEPVARSRGQWQEIEGILFSPKNYQLVHILIFHSQGVVFLFIFRTVATTLDSDPHGRRYVKNTGHNRNRLYSRAIHCTASMEKHYVQWFILKSAQDITVHVVYHIFAVSSSAGLGIEGYRTSWKDELGNHTLGMKAQNMHQLRVFGAK